MTPELQISSLVQALMMNPAKSFRNRDCIASGPSNQDLYLYNGTLRTFCLPLHNAHISYTCAKQCTSFESMRHIRAHMYM